MEWWDGRGCFGCRGGGCRMIHNPSLSFVFWIWSSAAMDGWDCYLTWFDLRDVMIWAMASGVKRMVSGRSDTETGVVMCGYGRSEKDGLVLWERGRSSWRRGRVLWGCAAWFEWLMRGGERGKRVLVDWICYIKYCRTNSKTCPCTYFPSLSSFFVLPFSHCFLPRQTSSSLISSPQVPLMLWPQTSRAYYPLFTAFMKHKTVSIDTTIPSFSSLSFSLFTFLLKPTSPSLLFPSFHASPVWFLAFRLLRRLIRWVCA